MSVSTLPASWQPIEESLADFRLEFVGFEHQMDDLLEDLERLRTELGRKANEVERQRAQVVHRERQLDEQRLENEQITQQLQQQETQLALAIRELQELKRNLASAPAPESGPQEVELLARQKRSEEERWREAERERVELEAELEMVRVRATELNEQLAEQRREAAEQRQQLTEELRQLRKLFESQSARLSAPVVTAEPTTPKPPVEAAERQTPEVPFASDPVVSSVMAQFAKLQQDVAGRRKKNKQQP